MLDDLIDPLPVCLRMLTNNGQSSVDVPLDSLVAAVTFAHSKTLTYHVLSYIFYVHFKTSMEMGYIC